MEMRSGPAAAIARTFFRVMPPETSTSARPSMSFTACLTAGGSHVVQENDVGFATKSVPNFR